MNEPQRHPLYWCRAILLGLAGAAAVCGLTYFNDITLRQTYLVGNNLPISVYGALILFLLIGNTLLLALWRRLALKGWELAIIIGMTLAACCIPGSGLLRTFTSSLMMPQQFTKTDPGWKGDSPQLELEQVKDWGALAAELQAAAATPGHPVRLVWDRLPPAVQQALRDLPRGGTPARPLQVSLVEALNQLLRDPDLARQEAFAHAALPLPIRNLREAHLQPPLAPGLTPGLRSEALAKLNRGLLEALLGASRPGLLVPCRPDIVNTADRRLLPDLSQDEDAALNAYLQGCPEQHAVPLVASVKGVARSGSATSLVLAAEEAAVDGAFAGLDVTLTADAGAAQRRHITGYVGATRTATVDRPWQPLPAAGVRYEIATPAPSWWQRWTGRGSAAVSGVALSGGPHTIGLGVTAATSDDACCDCQVTLLSGAGKGEQRTIVDYAGAGRLATVDRPWTTPPQAGDSYLLNAARTAAGSGRSFWGAASRLRGQVAAATATTLGLSEPASYRDRVYVGVDVSIVAGPGAGQTRRVTEYVGKTRTGTVDQAWDPVPEVTSSYELTPKPVVPWWAWQRTLTFWLPLILSIWFALIGLALVVHRQWSEHEHLPYPIAVFTDALLPAEGQALGSVFRNRLFWIGAVAVFLIHTNNFVTMLFPNLWVSIPLQLNLYSVVHLVKWFDGAWYFSSPAIYLTVIAFAYFLATDVAFSVALAPLFYTVVCGILAGYGISMQAGGRTFSANMEKFIVFGAYLGMLCILLYTGRHYYWTVCRRALFVPTRDRHDPPTIWGARLFIAGFGVFTGMLVVALHLDWQLAVLYAAGVVLTFLIMSRIIAETGIFFIQVYWFPCGIIAGLFGARALGPEVMLVLFLLSMVLLVDPREALMPFMANVLKIFDQRQLKLGRSAVLCLVALVAGLAVAVPTTLYLQYRYGAPLHDGWACRAVPQAPFEEAIGATRRLAAQGELEKARTVSGFARFNAAKPASSSLLVAGAAGFVLVLVFSLGRLRFPWWPLHPVIFLIWAAYPAKVFAFSFLLGAMLKGLVTKYGGARIYQQLKPLMFGVIAGELVAGLIPVVWGLVSYLISGELPRSYRIFPG